MRWKLEENQPDHVHLRSLRTRFMLPVLFVVFAMVGIAAGAGLSLSGAAEADARRNALTVARVASLAQERVLADARGRLESLLADSSVQARDAAACGAKAEALVAADSRIVEAGVAGAQGVTFCSSAKERGSVAVRRFFGRAKATGTLAVGDYEVLPGLDVPVLAVALPAKNAEGHVSAVAWVAFKVSALALPAGEDGLSAESGYGVLDSRGIMLVRHPEKDQWAGKALPETALTSEILSRKEGAIDLAGEDGIRRTYAFTRLKGDASLPLYVYVAIPRAEARANFDQALLGAAIVGSLLAALAFWLGLALGDLLILRRVRRLAMSMRRVVGGDLEERGHLQFGMGELDDITGIFDAITGKLEEAYATTEQKVKKRTVELEFNQGMSELEKARFEALLTSIGDGLFATDEQGKISFVNQEAQRMLGWTAKDMIGSIAYRFFRLEDEKGEVIPDEKRPTLVTLSTKKSHHSPVLPHPYYFVRKDKTRFPAQISATPIIVDDVVVGTIQVFRDVTDETEFDRRKSEFISIASHQLRSPLSATKWLSDMLRKGDVGPLQPKQKELADKLFDANERMVVLVNELLNVSRLEAGTTKLSPEPTAMGELIAGVIAEHAVILQSHGQKFDFAEKPLPTINVDRLLMREVLANIISNASKYSPEGSTVTVRAEDDGMEVRVSVKDQGIGIPRSAQKQMFRKFFRADNAAKSVITGTGLGLYVVKSIIELHGGKIWFESEENKGTTFFFTIPLSGAPPQPAGAAS